jgi:RNA polymerase sigma-70 factor (ECF subfamily)
MQRASGERPARSAPVSDEEIVLGLTRGEPRSAEQLYDRVHLHVQASLRRILRSTGPDYEDLVQASFERILKTLTERALKSPYNLPGWASAVATHVALDALRRRVREQRLFARFAQGPGLGEGDLDLARTSMQVGQQAPSTDPERALSARAELQRLQRILGAMNPKHADVLVLHDVLGHELSAIAEITGLTVAAAQSRLVRGRKDLLRRAQKDQPR